MTEHESPNMYHQCQAAVDRIVSRYGWRLLNREEFIRRVVTCVALGEVSDAWSAAIHVYCHCLYAACSGSEGELRQEIGFVELQRYLYEISLREARDLPVDVLLEVVNDTLCRIWQRLGSYRKPGSFLAIAGYELRNAIRPFWSRPPVLPLDEVPEQSDIRLEEDLEQTAINSELRRQVKDCFDLVLQEHPRARQQLEAVWLKYIVGLDDTTISNRLGKSIANVQVLRSRGLNHLRSQRSWQQLAQDFEL